MSGRWSGGGCAALRASVAVYLGGRACGNLPAAGSARPARSFQAADTDGVQARTGVPRRSHGETLPATTLALDVRIPEAEGFVQPLLHEVDDSPIDQPEAFGVHEHPYSAVLEDRIARLGAVGIVDHVRKPRAAGLAHP